MGNHDQFSRILTNLKPNYLNTYFNHQTVQIAVQENILSCQIWFC